MSKDDSPYAFARPASIAINKDGVAMHIYPQSGMTLRDYFAAAALPQLMIGARSFLDAAGLASGAYVIADAMLAERAK